MTKFQPTKKINNNEKVVISIRLNLDKVEELDKIANKINISRNELISQCLDFAVKNLDFKKNNKKND